MSRMNMSLKGRSGAPGTVRKLWRAVLQTSQCIWRMVELEMAHKSRKKTTCAQRADVSQTVVLHVNAFTLLCTSTSSWTVHTLAAPWKQGTEGRRCEPATMFVTAFMVCVSHQRWLNLESDAALVIPVVCSMFLCVSGVTRCARVFQNRTGQVMI